MCRGWLQRVPRVLLCMLTSAAAACQCEAGGRVRGAHGAAAAAGSRVVRRLCSTRSHLLVRALLSPLHARHCPRGSRGCGRFDSGCIVAVGVVKTVEHAAAGLPLPRKVQAARAAKAADAKSAASASASSLHRLRPNSSLAPGRRFLQCMLWQVKSCLTAELIGICGQAMLMNVSQRLHKA